MKPFEARYEVDPVTGCWLWLMSTTAAGYGNYRADGRHVYAHRFSYEQAHGPIPPGLEIDHKCRVRKCVNPAHLEAVTPGENTRRGLAMGNQFTKGQTWTQGSKHGASKLTEAQVLAIRCDRRSHRLIAEGYGISRVHVSDIKARKVWKHI